MSDSQIERIPFHGGEVLSVRVDGKPYVVLRPIVDDLGLSFSPQHRKLAGKSWTSMLKLSLQLPGQHQQREYVLIDVRTLLMWVATVDEAKVADRVRPLLIAYQAEIADVIEAHWADRITSTGAQLELVPDSEMQVAAFPSSAEQWAALPPEMLMGMARLAEEGRRLAETVDLFLGTEGLVSVADAAKAYKDDMDIDIPLGRDRLYVQLSQEGWVYRDKGDGAWRVYQHILDADRMRHREHSEVNVRGFRKRLPPTPYFTRKGMEDFRQVLRKRPKAIGQ